MLNAESLRVVTRQDRIREKIAGASQSAGERAGAAMRGARRLSRNKAIMGLAGACAGGAAVVAAPMLITGIVVTYAALQGGAAIGERIASREV